MPALRSSLTRSQSRKNNANETSNKKSSNQNSQSSSPPASNASSDQARSSVELALPWTTRDRIVNSLNQFSMLLFSQTVRKDVKELAVKQTNHLMTALIGLKSSDAQTGDEERPKKRVRTDESGESGETSSRPFFLIPLRLRSEILDQLVCNMDAVCYPSPSLDESSKNRMREQNNRRNIELLSLPVTLMSSASFDESDPFDQLPAILEANTDKSSQKLDQIVAVSQFELLTTLSSEIRSVRESVQKLKSLQESVQKLETTVQRFEATRSEITLNHELNGVESFFSSNSGSRRYSKLYMCGDCPWSILLNVIEREEEGRVVKYLGFFLQCERMGDANEQWSMPVCFDLILLSPSNIVVDQIRYNYTFKQISVSEGRSYGKQYFITYDSLRNKGCVEDDRIKVRIELKCNQLVVG